MTAAYAGHCAAGNSPALQFYSRHHRHHFLLATDAPGPASLYFVCTTIRLLKPVGAEERITDRGCGGMEDQCHLHRHYDGMPADSNDPLGDIRYTLFLRDPYRTLVFHVPPEMHADQVV